MSFLNDVLNIFIKYYPQLLTGVGNTLLIALTSTAAGLALGLLTGCLLYTSVPHGGGAVC